MDFKDLEDYSKKQEEGIEVDILHPATGVKLCAITLVGPDSRRARIALRKSWSTLLKNRDLKKTPFDEDDEEDYREEVLARAIISWREVKWEGKEFPCTYENAVRLLKTFPFICSQLDQSVKDRSRFL